MFLGPASSQDAPEPHIVDPAGDAAGGKAHLDVLSGLVYDDGARLFVDIGVDALTRDPDPAKQETRHGWRFHFITTSTTFPENVRHVGLMALVCLSSDESLPASVPTLATTTPAAATTLGATVWAGFASGENAVAAYNRIDDGRLAAAFDVDADLVRLSMDFELVRANSGAMPIDLASAGTIGKMWVETVDAATPCNPNPPQGLVQVDVTDGNRPFLLSWQVALAPSSSGSPSVPATSPGATDGSGSPSSALPSTTSTSSGAPVNSSTGAGASPATAPDANGSPGLGALLSAAAAVTVAIAWTRRGHR